MSTQPVVFNIEEAEFIKLAVRAYQDYAPYEMSKRKEQMNARRRRDLRRSIVLKLEVAKAARR